MTGSKIPTTSARTDISAFPARAPRKILFSPASSSRWRLSRGKSSVDSIIVGGEVKCQMILFFSRKKHQQRVDNAACVITEHRFTNEAIVNSKTFQEPATIFAVGNFSLPEIRVSNRMPTLSNFLLFRHVCPVVTTSQFKFKDVAFVNQFDSFRV